MIQLPTQMEGITKGNDPIHRKEVLKWQTTTRIAIDFLDFCQEVELLHR